MVIVQYSLCHIKLSGGIKKDIKIKKNKDRNLGQMNRLIYT